MPGGRFDHIEFFGATDADVLLDQSIDPSHVSWSIAWRTVHWTTQQPYARSGSPQTSYRDIDHYDATYFALVYASGPGLPE